MAPPLICRKRISRLNAGSIQCRNRSAKRRDRNLIAAGRAVDVAVVTDGGFEITAQQGSFAALPLIDGIKEFLDGGIHFLGRILALDSFEFLLRSSFSPVAK